MSDFRTFSRSSGGLDLCIPRVLCHGGGTEVSFHIPGVESEIRPLSWLGCGVGVGPALAYMKSGKSREFVTGFGWTLHVSTEWLPTRHVGIGAKILLQQMLVRRSLYSAVGGVAGAGVCLVMTALSETGVYGVVNSRIWMLSRFSILS